MSQYQGHPDQKYGYISYAQHGEDFLLVNIFEAFGISKPTYLDLGAHSPIVISNTKLLYDRGASGVNIEANPNLIEAFNRDRPRDKNICVGVGPVRGKAKFYMYDDYSGRNTFSLEETVSLRGVMKLSKTVELDVMTLNEIVVAWCGGVFPHLLSVDLEGLDYDVLSTADFTVGAPLVIIVETRKKDSGRMRYMIEQKGFYFLLRMGENLIFINNSVSFRQ